MSDEETPEETLAEPQVMIPYKKVLEHSWKFVLKCDDESKNRELTEGMSDYEKLHFHHTRDVQKVTIFNLLCVIQGEMVNNLHKQILRERKEKPPIPFNEWLKAFDGRFPNNTVDQEGK